nr:hypothetical protein [Candidatus Njordarchaeota archaeon]
MASRKHRATTERFGRWLSLAISNQKSDFSYIEILAPVIQDNRAIRSTKVVAESFDRWSGEVLDQTAFPAKLAELAGVPWQEAHKHAQD